MDSKRVLRHDESGTAREFVEEGNRPSMKTDYIPCQIDESPATSPSIGSSEYPILTATERRHDYTPAYLFPIPVDDKSDVVTTGTLVSQHFVTEVTNDVPRISPNTAIQSNHILSIFARARASVPSEEWRRIPADAAENLDRYLYGA